MDGNTLWALVEEEELFHLFTIVDDKDEPIKPHPFITTAFDKMVKAYHSANRETKFLSHTLVLHQIPSPRVDAMLRIIDGLQKRSLTWAAFSSRYRNKGWPQLMERLMKKAKADELVNFAVGMMYVVMTPASSFEQLRKELKGLGVLNPVQAIERFINYVGEIPEEEFGVNDLERAIGRRLIEDTQFEGVYQVDDDEMGFRLKPSSRRARIALFQTRTESVYERTQLSPSDHEMSESILHRFGEGDSDSESSIERISLRSPTLTMALERPEIDEEVDWDWVMDEIRKRVESRYVELKTELRLTDDVFLVRFIKQFIGMANRAQLDNKRGHIIVGVEDSTIRHDFWDDASYQEFLKQHIRPKPDFTFKPHVSKSFECGIFLIHPVGKRPFVAAKSIFPRENSTEVVQDDCFLREGTETVKLDTDRILEMQRELTLRYGIK